MDNAFYFGRGPTFFSDVSAELGLHGGGGRD